ncbi:MAG: branched-chain amino acid ABC transporter permease [Fastidiosipilaceae bacterium]|jgi:branched-chain amino acid transport system permease protein|nr:branched-chain amino acid ABC transporter permease [Clostridiaceae bacterium]
MKKSSSRVFKTYVLNIVIIAAIFIALQLMITNGVFNSYTSGLVVQIFINMILTLSLNVATGFLGELCLGHAGFMAIGAYTTALLTINSGLPVMIMFPLGLIAGMIISGIIGFLVGVPALRLKGDYLAIITLAFGEMISILLRTFKFTGGALGLNGIPRVTSFAYSYWCFIISLVLIITFMFSRHGRAILSIREDEIASEATGVNTFKYKMIAFVMSAMFAGLAGGLFAHFQGNLAPEKFNYNYSIDIMVMVVFGGMGSVSGSIVSAIILTLLPELLRGFSEFRMLVYAIMLIVLMIFRPEGMFGRKEVTYRVFRRFLKRNKQNKPVS